METSRAELARPRDPGLGRGPRRERVAGGGQGLWWLVAQPHVRAGVPRLVCAGTSLGEGGRRAVLRCAREGGSCLGGCPARDLGLLARRAARGTGVCAKRLRELSPGLGEEAALPAQGLSQAGGTGPFFLRWARSIAGCSPRCAHLGGSPVELGRTHFCVSMRIGCG